MSSQRPSTSSIPTLILTNPGTTPEEIRTSSGTNICDDVAGTSINDFEGKAGMLS